MTIWGKARDWLAERLKAASDRVPVSAASPPCVVPASPTENYTCIGAQDEKAAYDLFLAAKESDPFPDIAPALLNSAHIEDYMVETAMVFPYHRERRKTASYAMRIGGWKAFWDPTSSEGDVPFKTLHDRQTFELPPNSLVYVKTKEIFQLPNYMAVRFNLHIDLVHKGLLLGTGPLVDPGFRGHLLVPLHNMTANTYLLAENDEFIWAEFTKTSLTEDWRRPGADKKIPSAAFAEFPKDKFDQPVEIYLMKAMRPHALASAQDAYPFPANAIPKAVEEGRKLARSAETQAKDARRSVTTVTRWGYAAGAALTFSLVGLVLVSWQMVQSTLTMIDDSNEEIRTLKGQVATLQLLRSDAAAAEVIEARRAYCQIVGTDDQAAKVREAARNRFVVAARKANSAARATGQSEPFQLGTDAKSIVIPCE